MTRELRKGHQRVTTISQKKLRKKKRPLAVDLQTNALHSILVKQSLSAKGSRLPLGRKCFAYQARM